MEQKSCNQQPAAQKLIQKDHRYSNLDPVKFLCALLVVEIHTAPLRDISETADFYLSHVLARIAVPLFFAISGFLFFRKLQWDNGKIAKTSSNRARLFRFLKQNGKIYLIWSIVYILFSIPKWYRSGWWGKVLLKDIFSAFFFHGTYYHMWYLLASIYAMPILYVLLQSINRRMVMLMAVFLWLCQCMTYSYYWIETPDIAMISWLGSKIPIIFSACYCAVPLLLAGCICAEKEQIRNSKKQAMAAAGAFLLCAVEASFLHFLTPNDGKYSYLFATPIFAYAAVRFLTGPVQLEISGEICRTLRNMSLTIYCLHPLVIDICTYIGITDGVRKWIVTMIVCISSSFAVDKYQHR